MGSIEIKSDFSDCYDLFQTYGADVKYNRYKSSGMSRAEELLKLKRLGINTIELKQVNSIGFLDETIVVYTDPYKHDGCGKKIMTCREAKQMYGNYPASQFIADSDGYSSRFLQLGKRKFSLTYHKDDIMSLSHGVLVDIREYDSDYNRYFSLPIFSIDYIQHKGVMLATDFNCAENITDIVRSGIIDEQSVIDEIYNSIIFYNRLI